MRLIGTIENERNALIFSNFLRQKGISHQIEVEKNHNWDSHAYGSSKNDVWVVDEEHFEKVLSWFHLFLENPENPLFKTADTIPPQWIKLQPSSSQTSTKEPPPSSRPPPQSWNRQPMGWITRGLLGICTFLFFLTQLSLPTLQTPEKYSGLALFTSPIDKALLYDYPKFYELINRFIQSYGFDELEHPEELPPEGTALLKQINHTPFWPGFYQLMLKGGWSAVKEGFSKYPAFEKIDKGEVWRLFTPCLLHGDIFHLVFNMLWLIVLGKQIEQRLTPIRYGIFILVIGVISNTAQYLMSGPNFIGFSGVLMGMLSFIWVRQKIAAWEGYQIDRLTFIFMLVYILSMAAIQFISFFLEKSFDWALSPNIANMAHLTGGVVGYILGRFNFFSWRHA